MKISSLRIKNILSYEDAVIKFNDYNVIVGPNGAGKTNLTRLLKLISTYNNDPNNSNNSLLDIKLRKSFRFSFEKNSSVIFEITLTEQELKLLLEFLMMKEIIQLNYDSLKDIRLIIHWKRTPDEYVKPDFLLFSFSNGLLLCYSEGHYFVGFIKNLSNDIEEILIQISSLKELVTVIDETNFKNKYSFDPPNLFLNEKFQHIFLNGNFETSYQDLYTRKLGNARISFTRPYDITEYIVNFFEYCGITQNRFGRELSIWDIICSIFHNNILVSSEIRPSISELAMDLLYLEKSVNMKQIYNKVCSSFETIFPGVKFEIIIESRMINLQKKESFSILILETSGKTFVLEDSASGYYEILCIFKDILRISNGILILDEPALHLHPVKIKLLGRTLETILDSGQIIIITHSPYFVESSLFSSYRNLIYIKRNNTGSSEISSQDYKNGKLNFNIPSYILKPQIFFSRASIIVEGASDSAIFAAISDFFDSILDKYDISIINVDGIGNIQKYYEPILRRYKIEFAAMTDSDYGQTPTNNIYVLSKDLEAELQKLGWNHNNKKKVHPEEAYNFIFNMMQSTSGRIHIHKSIFGKLLTYIISKINQKDPF